MAFLSKLAVNKLAAWFSSHQAEPRTVFLWPCKHFKRERLLPKTKQFSPICVRPYQPVGKPCRPPSGEVEQPDFTVVLRQGQEVVAGDAQPGRSGKRSGLTLLSDFISTCLAAFLFLFRSSKSNAMRSGIPTLTNLLTPESVLIFFLYAVKFLVSHTFTVWSSLAERISSPAVNTAALTVLQTDKRTKKTDKIFTIY